jgi:peptidyl-prolyl cis-trans isomerase D
MSVIQKIRDKYARVAVIAIALALLGFILMDALVGRSSLFRGGPSNNIGVVNGKSIGITDFNNKLTAQENFMAQQGYGQPGEALRQQALNAVWDQEVSRILLEEEKKKLGLQISNKELDDIVFGVNASEDFKKQFVDPATGQYSPSLAKRQINEMKRKGTQEQKLNFENYLDQLEFQRLNDKFNSLLTNSANFPRWKIEKENTDAGLLGKISLVREVYSSIPDSLVKISDKEISDYVSKHKDDYKQEESRAISYVSFNASPSAADSADAMNKALALKEQLAAATDIKQFLASEGARYYGGYISGKTIQIPVKDSIFRLPVGSIYGPYLDGGNYMVAKLIGVRPVADTVTVRHILIGLQQQDPQTGQAIQVRDSATAYKIADSVRLAIANGSNFDTLVNKLSDDQGSKSKGGVYENVTSGQMVHEFNDFIITNPVGAKGVVSTEFGAHYIEIMSQKGSSTGYNIAYVGRPIIASNETDNAANNAANEFAGDSRDQKSFDANYEKTLKPKGIQKAVAVDIKPTSFEIPGVGVSRTLVRNIYDAKKGQVLQPERVGDAYIVALVTEVNEEGTPTVEKVRASVEPLLRNKKKAEIIKQKIGKVTTLEAAASALGKPIQTIDSLRMTGRSNSQELGYEPRVSGAAFNPSNRGKVVPEALEGVSGLYVIRVDNVTATQVPGANVAEQRNSLYQQAKQAGAYGTIQALRSAATIKDRRAERY